MSDETPSLNFIEQIIEDDIFKGLPNSQLRFRFPPEPNGFLHIGHAKAICLNFGLGETYQAPVNLRFDDTNPAKEEQKYVDAIIQDIEWLGFKYDKICYTSDYFEQLFNWAIKLIKNGVAYVDDQSAEIINAQRKTPFEVGENSPYRNRSVDDNLKLFMDMKNGLYDEGAKVLRAKIDMGAPNMNMRDPVMYRIIKKPHHRTQNAWNIYPMYDWAHGQSDYIEQVSHSLCSMEFENHRPLYEWYIQQVFTSDIRPKQREFARLNLNYTVTSKRKLQRLVEEGIVNGWDDPRMPTIAGLRRRGYTPESIRVFCNKAGVSKRDNQIDVALLEFAIRDHLNKTAPRIMAVVNPIKLVITNYPENQTEWVSTENNPENPESGNRNLPFSRELYIEREDFMENAPSKFFRLTIGQEVRLKAAYIIKAESVEKDAQNEITVVYATYDPDSKSGSGSQASQRKVKGTLHWVSANEALPMEVRHYDRLFITEQPDGDKDIDFIDSINPHSLSVTHGFVEPLLNDSQPGDRFQFQRIGYFCVDSDSQPNRLVFNRTVGLKDTWAKEKKKG